MIAKLIKSILKIKYDIKKVICDYIVKRDKLTVRKINAKEKIKKAKSHMQMSKILIIFIITNCSIVEIYAMFAMFWFKDMSSIGTLITAVVGETLSFMTYAAKSFFETKEEKSLEFEKEKLDSSLQSFTIDTSNKKDEEQDNNTSGNDTFVLCDDTALSDAYEELGDDDIEQLDVTSSDEN